MQFVTALIEHIASENRIFIEQHEISGGGRAPRTVRVIRGGKPAGDEEYYVLVVNCRGDDLVKERIREEHQNLADSDYVQIIGIRDVRPTFTRAEIPKLEAGLGQFIDPSLIPVQFVLSIMEVEAWFLQEASHFSRLNPSIDLHVMRGALGFDPENEDMSLRETPKRDIDDCYRLVGLSYIGANPSTTINALDMSIMQLQMPARIPYLRSLVDSISNFLN